jgi:periplasmic protein TonB
MSTIRSAITQRSGGSIAPVWQRPLACCVVVLAHAAIILAVTWPNFNVNVPVHLQISVVAQGEPAQSLSAVDSQPTQEVKPESQQLQETTPAEFKRESADATEIQTKEPIETPTREPDLPDAKAISPAPLTEAKEAQEAELTKAIDAEDLPEVKVASDTVETSTLAAPANVPLDVRRPEAQREEPERREKAAESHKRPRHAALEPQAASQIGAPSTRGRAGAATGAVSTATYRSLVIAELSRHKQYPPAALSAGVQGTVVVTFTIGPSGRVVAHTITRSSGSGALDSAVHRMMAAVSLPPPPGGIYRATAPVEFVLHR